MPRVAEEKLSLKDFADIIIFASKTFEWFGTLLGHETCYKLIRFTEIISTGTKMPRMNWRDISSLNVAVPPKLIAVAFDKLVEPLLGQIRANLHQSLTLVTLRNTLLPKLLSGEVNVNSRTN